MFQDEDPEFPEPEVERYPLAVILIIWTGGLALSGGVWAAIFYFWLEVPLKITLTVYTLLLFLVLAWINAGVQIPRPQSETEWARMLQKIWPWGAH